MSLVIIYFGQYTFYATNVSLLNRCYPEHCSRPSSLFD